jgi:transposase
MYQNFMGIDISKENFAVAVEGNEKVKFFSNDKKGFDLIKKTYKDILGKTLVVLETTGGYEIELIHYLQSLKVAVHRANTRKVKNYIRSFGKLGKTDVLDASAC